MVNDTALSIQSVNQVTVFMNGVVVSRSDGSNVKAVQASAPLHVGRYYDGQYPFDGNISSLIFAKGALSLKFSII